LETLLSQNESSSTGNTFYRAMKPDVDGVPVMGRSARTLGVRIPVDIAPDEGGLVRPGTGGMSVAPESIWNIPNHRRPRGMQGGSTGPAGDFVYGIAEISILHVGLLIRSDQVHPAIHAFVEPSAVMELSKYEADLGSTRVAWRKLWP